MRATTGSAWAASSSESTGASRAASCATRTRSRGERSGTFHGLQTVPTDDYIATVRALHRQGWRVATHAVGDAAIDLVLDGYEAADSDAPIAGQRWVIEHGFIPRDDQFPRMRDLGLAVTAQHHLYVAAPSLVEYWGADRAAWTTPVRAYLDAGIPVSLGSDSPVVPWDPWSVLHHFTTRATISAGVHGASQRITREEALRAMTQGYAHLTFAEADKGTLEVGRLADLVVTAEHYLDCADPCLETMQVDMTVVGGGWCTSGRGSQGQYAPAPSLTGPAGRNPRPRRALPGRAPVCSPPSIRSARHFAFEVFFTVPGGFSKTTSRSTNWMTTFVPDRTSRRLSTPRRARCAPTRAPLTIAQGIRHEVGPGVLERVGLGNAVRPRETPLASVQTGE